MQQVQNRMDIGRNLKTLHFLQQVKKPQSFITIKI